MPSGIQFRHFQASPLACRLATSRRRIEFVACGPHLLFGLLSTLLRSNAVTLTYEPPIQEFGRDLHPATHTPSQAHKPTRLRVGILACRGDMTAPQMTRSWIPPHGSLSAGPEARHISSLGREPQVTVYATPIPSPGGTAHSGSSAMPWPTRKDVYRPAGTQSAGGANLMCRG